MDLSLQTLLLRLVAMLVVIALHGLLLALVAGAFGAKGPRYDGRFTLNPLAHLDLLAAIPFLLAQIGWIRPMTIDLSELKGGRHAAWLVGLLALVLTLAVAIALWLARPWLLAIIPNLAVASGTSAAIRAVLETSTWFVLVNLLPLPPLTMGLALGAVSARAADFANRHSLLIRLALVVLAVAAETLLRPWFATVFAVVAMGRA